MLSECHTQSSCNVIGMHCPASACIILHHTHRSMQDKQTSPNFHVGRCCPKVQLPSVRSGLVSSKAAVPRRDIGKLPRFCAPVFTSLPVFAAVQPSVVIYADKRKRPASEDGHSPFAVQESVGKVGSSITM